MVNQHHALIFSKKKAKTIIGVLVNDFFIFYFYIYNFLVKVEVA